MDSGNRTTVKLCARRTGLNFNGRQSGGTLSRPSVWKWLVAQAAVLLGLCPTPLILSCRRHSPEQKQDPRATRFSGIRVLHRTQNRSISAIALSTSLISPCVQGRNVLVAAPLQPAQC